MEILAGERNSTAVDIRDYEAGTFHSETTLEFSFMVSNDDLTWTSIDNELYVLTADTDFVIPEKYFDYKYLRIQVTPTDASREITVTLDDIYHARAFSTGEARSTVNNGELADVTGLTVEEFGEGTLHRVVLTFDDVHVSLTDEADTVAYGGLKIYTLPEAWLYALSCIVDLALTKSSTGVNATWDGDFGVGTATASNNAGLTGTECDVVDSTATPQAVAGATTATAQQDIGELRDYSSETDLYINLLVDDADHDVAGTACDLILNGTITLLYIKADA